MFTKWLPRDDNHPGAERAAIGHESDYPGCLERFEATTPQLRVTDEGSRASLTDQLAKLSTFLLTSIPTAECSGSGSTRKYM